MTLIIPGKVRRVFKVIKPTIEAGQPSNLISFHGEHPEPYSDYQLDQLKHNQKSELLGLVGCAIIITLVFFGLVLIL